MPRSSHAPVASSVTTPSAAPVAPARRPARQRRTAEETRQLLLTIAKNLLLTKGVSTAVSHIRLQEVLRTAGLTTGAAYRIWADQDEFQKDLAASVIEWRLDPSTASTREVVCEAGWPADIDEVVRRGAERHTATFGAAKRNDPESRIFLFALALRATSQGSPRLVAASSARHEHSVAEFTAFYTEAMTRYGLRLRGDYTMTHFTTAMAALGEGFALQALEGIDHPLVARRGCDGNEQEWTLFGAAVAGLVREFFVPCEPDARPGGTGDTEEGAAEPSGSDSTLR